LIWAGRYGGVDPWTKANEVSDQADALMVAKPGMTYDQALAIAQSDVTAALVSAGADPSQAGQDEDLITTLGTILTWGLIIGVGYVLVQVFFLSKKWEEVLSP
jgi:hypothetical protein